MLIEQVASGAIVAFAHTSESLWLLSEHAVLRHTPQGWQRIATPPMSSFSALALAEGVCWLAGAEGLVRSPDAGANWQLCYTDRTEAAITCLLCSPNYEHDRTLLAGTAGEGVLRSTDGGRRWLQSSFGLHEFGVLCLAAGTWQRREPVLAGTLDGVYRSAGGGRGWQHVGLAGEVVLALAVAGEQALAGSEAGELFRSTNGGRSWAHDPHWPASGEAINGLAWLPGTGWLAGSASGALWCDAGRGWQRLRQGTSSVLAVGVAGRTAYAGLADGQLFCHQGHREH